MNRIGKFLRQVATNSKQRLGHFMLGRYGTDKLNIAILGMGVALCLAARIIRLPLVDLLLIAASYGLMFWAIFRMLSRNIYQRYQENRKYLRFLERLKDREHRYFDCPKCRQPVRVPRGKGKISITCPKCKEKFIRKS